MTDTVATFLTREQLAAKYPIAASTLARLASEGRGPPYYTPIGVVMYDEMEFVAWIRSAKVVPSDRDKSEAKGGRGRKRSLPIPVTRSVAPEAEKSGRQRGRPRKNLQPTLFSCLQNEAEDDAA